MTDKTVLNNGIVEPNNICPNCKKSYPEVTFPPMDGDNLCNDCYDDHSCKTDDNNIIIGSFPTFVTPEYCEYHEKLEESNYTFQCVKFREHKGKHFIIGREIG